MLIEFYPLLPMRYNLFNLTTYFQHPPINVTFTTFNLSNFYSQIWQQGRKQVADWPRNWPWWVEHRWICCGPGSLQLWSQSRFGLWRVIHLYNSKWHFQVYSANSDYELCKFNSQLACINWCFFFVFFFSSIVMGQEHWTIPQDFALLGQVLELHMEHAEER